MTVSNQRRILQLSLYSACVAWLILLEMEKQPTLAPFCSLSYSREKREKKCFVTSGRTSLRTLLSPPEVVLVQEKHYSLGKFMEIFSVNLAYSQECGSIKCVGCIEKLYVFFSRNEGVIRRLKAFTDEKRT